MPTARQPRRSDAYQRVHRSASGVNSSLDSVNSSFDSVCGRPALVAAQCEALAASVWMLTHERRAPLALLDAAEAVAQRVGSVVVDGGGV